MTATTTVPVPSSDGSARAELPSQPAPAARFGRSTKERGALIALLLATAVLYVWGLGASGYANEFYSAAVQAGTKSWKAMFFGSFDSSNFITVDKPPASLWPMEIAGRIFGFNSWSMLLPQAIEGVLAVWLLYATVRRWFGANAGLLAGALLAITPVAVLMFRFNNPDALMTLLIVAAAYCVTRALDNASARWLALAGAAIGFSFLAKGLQPFTVLPALTLAYLVAAPTALRRRLLHLLAAGGALVAGAGWWVLIVQLTPAADRPYIGGSGDNTALGLALGYNGLSRITGESSGPGGGAGGGANFSGTSGIGRLFNSLNGGQIAWLLPTALIALVAVLAITRHAPRTDRTRAAAIIWGGWLLVTAGVLSFASGIIHTYYSIELAPAVAAMVAVGAVTLWRHRDEAAVRLTLAGAVIVTGWWSYTLLHRTPSWNSWVADLVVLSTLIAAILLVVPRTRFAHGSVIAATAAVIALAGGPAAYALNTAATAHTGSTPSAGPTVTGAQGGFGGGGRPGGGRLPTGGFGGGTGTTGGRPNFGGGTPPTGTGSGGTTAGGQTGARPGVGAGTAPSGAAGGAQTASSALTALLKATTTKWAAATVGSQSAAPLELASGKAVIAIGGFSGTDDAPTLAQFKALVAAGEIRYFIGGGQSGGPGGGQGASSAISTWVAANYTSTTVGGSTVYDLTKASTS